MFFFLGVPCRRQRRAAGYLEAILSQEAQQSLPYVSREPAARLETSVARAVCRVAQCLFETNIPLLPADLLDDDKNNNNGEDEDVHMEASRTRRHHWHHRRPRDMLELESSRRDRLSNRTTIQLYMHHPPSSAVDDRAETYFQSVGGEYCSSGVYVCFDCLGSTIGPSRCERCYRSRSPKLLIIIIAHSRTLPSDATAGEYIILDYFHDFYRSHWIELRLVWLVDQATERTLQTSDLATSSDGLTWVSQFFMARV